MTENIIRTEEPTPVQLTRMEGVLNLVAERIANVSGRLEKTDARVDRHEEELSRLKLSTQQLGADAIARDATVAATAKALREAKEAQDAATNAETSKSERSWSPVAKASVLIATLATLWSLFGPALIAN